MTVRVAIDLPTPLYEELRQKADDLDASLESLVLQAIDSMLQKSEKRAYVTGPLIRGKGKRGPRYPTNKNPWDLIF